jgi:hypothetical protein
MHSEVVLVKPLSENLKRGSGIEDAFVKMSRCVHSSICFTVPDTLFRKTLEITQARFKEEIAYKRRKLDLEVRQLLLREQEAGLISHSEYRKEKKSIGKTQTCHSTPFLPSSPTQNLASSPEWDLERLSEQMENSSDEIGDDK